MWNMKHILMTLGFAASALASPHVLAQALPCGQPINVEVAKKAAQAAVSEMRKNRVEMTIAVVDSEWQPGSSGAIETGGPGNH